MSHSEHQLMLYMLTNLVLPHVESYSLVSEWLRIKNTINIAIEHHTNCPKKFIDPKSEYFNGKLVVIL